MADINIANLPDSPLPILDGDFIHTSQSAADYKIKITDLADRFNVVDIFGLTQTTTPASSNFVPISTSGTVDGNRRSSLFNMGKLYQANEFFVTGVVDLELTDESIYRDGSVETLQQATFQDVRDLTLNMNLGFSSHSDPVISDKYLVFDSTATEAKIISGLNLQTEMTDPSNYSPLPSSPAAADTFIIRENSTNFPRSITYATLEAAIAGSIDISDVVDLSTAQTISGTKTFTSASGIKTDRIEEATADTGVTIDGVTMMDSNLSALNVTATNLSGKFIGTGGNGSTDFINVASLTSQVQIGTTSDNFNNTTASTGIYGSSNVDKGLIPHDDNFQFLGTYSNRWRNISAGRGEFNSIFMPKADDATQSPSPQANLTSNFFLDDVPMTTGSGNATMLNAARIQSALTDQKGLIQLATDSEAQLGTSNSLAITPKTLKATLDAQTSFGTVVGVKVGRTGNVSEGTLPDGFSITVNTSSIYYQLNFPSGTRILSLQVTPATSGFIGTTNSATAVSHYIYYTEKLNNSHNLAQTFERSLSTHFLMFIY